MKSSIKADFSVAEDGVWEMRISGVKPDHPELQRVLVDWASAGMFVRVVEEPGHGDK